MGRLTSFVSDRPLKNPDIPKPFSALMGTDAVTEILVVIGSIVGGFTSTVKSAIPDDVRKSSATVLVKSLVAPGMIPRRAPSKHAFSTAFCNIWTLANSTPAKTNKKNIGATKANSTDTDPRFRFLNLLNISTAVKKSFVEVKLAINFVTGRGWRICQQAV